jgi:hypothetical protein
MGIMEQLDADIDAKNNAPWEPPHRDTDLLNLWYEIVAGLERQEWSRDELVELVDRAVSAVRSNREADEADVPSSL